MSQTMANLVDVRGVSFSRANRLIFDDISLTVPRGKITAIMGPSGIGKTTLLRLIGGQIPPDSGEILFDGENIPEMSRSRHPQQGRGNRPGGVGLLLREGTQ